MKLLICDDEEDILEGLKQVIDWQKLGFTEILGTNNSKEALDLILSEKPDIVLLDINMPNLGGFGVIKQAKEKEFDGEFIIISGFSEFAYAQKAIKYNVSSYLCKPIDEDELESNIIKLIESLKQRKSEKEIFTNYEKELMKKFICDFIDNNTVENKLFKENDMYQVIAYDNFYKNKSEDVSDLNEILQLSNNVNYVYFKKNNVNLVLLIGEETILYLEKIKNKYLNSSQKNSIFDKLFLYYGKVVYNFNDIKNSYNDIFKLMEYRFFSKENQHFFSYEYLYNFTKNNNYTLDTKSLIYDFSDCIQKLDINKLDMLFNNLNSLIKNNPLSRIKTLDYLSEIYFNTIQNINRFFSDMDIIEESYSMAMDIMKSKFFLYEILDYMKEKFILIINTIKFKSNNNSMYKIISYIEENCQENLKLKTIADKFNYNSSYLGKLFTKTTGESFNMFLEKTRIEKSKTLLVDRNLKIYEVAEKVGYNNVDYFHKKFKNIVKKSPLEYRKSLDN